MAFTLEHTVGKRLSKQAYLSLSECYSEEDNKQISINIFSGPQGEYNAIIEAYIGNSGYAVGSLPRFYGGIHRRIFDDMPNFTKEKQAEFCKYIAIDMALQLLYDFEEYPKPSVNDALLYRAVSNMSKTIKDTIKTMHMEYLGMESEEYAKYLES